MTGINSNRSRFCVFASLCLAGWWMLCSAGCEPPPYVTYLELGYPQEIRVGAEGCDTTLRGDVAFMDLYAQRPTEKNMVRTYGEKDKDGMSETLDDDWLHVKSEYRQRRLRIRVNLNKTGETRNAYLFSLRNRVRIIIAQKAEPLDSIAEANY